MIDQDNIQQVAASASQHADNLFADIENAQTRIEHIRLTALAIEARHVANRLNLLATRYAAVDSDRD